MLDPVELAKTLYLGDRALRAILIDGWERKVAFTVTCISRVRPGTTTWDFYSERDIENGVIVLTGVESLRLEPGGPLPNDYINDLSVHRVETEGGTAESNPLFEFRLNVSSVGDDATHTEVVIEVNASGMHLEDPSLPGIELRD
jgi:hypothetical protein